MGVRLMFLSMVTRWAWVLLVVGLTSGCVGHGRVHCQLDIEFVGDVVVEAVRSDG